MRTSLLLLLAFLLPLLSSCFAAGSSLNVRDDNTLGRVIDEEPSIPGPSIPETPVILRNDGLPLYPLSYQNRAIKYNPNTFRGFIYTGTFKGRRLHQKYEEGRFVLLGKGDFWEMRPQDWREVWTWGYQDRIEVFKSPDTMFPYGFFNKERGSSVNIRFLGYN